MQAPEPTGPAMQQAPQDMPRPAARMGGPILPPLMAPQPSWKQEAKPPEPPAAAPEPTPAPETKPDEGENKG